MNYGKINNGSPDITKEIAALEDLLSKGEIDEEKFKKESRELNRLRLLYIARTNGGYTNKKSKKKARIQTLKEADLARHSRSIEE